VILVILIIHTGFGSKAKNYGRTAWCHPDRWIMVEYYCNISKIWFSCCAQK